ncbi:putative transferase [Helianthus debilis subsp. tardiflorus]
MAPAGLPKFYSTDQHSEVWRVFSECGKRCVLTANPTLMLEPFLKKFLGADLVLGTEIDSWNGRATELVKPAGVLVRCNKADTLLKAFKDTSLLDLAHGDRKTDYPYIKLCKIPIGFVKLPKPWYSIGVRVYIKGTPLLPAKRSRGQIGSSLSSPIAPTVTQFSSPLTSDAQFLVTYFISRLSEIISPIKTVGLTRDQTTDANMIKNLLEECDLAICPKGTTCREPFLLRVSALFSELTNELVSLAIRADPSPAQGGRAHPRGKKI